jgi:hypothetical protein
MTLLTSVCVTVMQVERVTNCSVQVSCFIMRMKREPRGAWREFIVTPLKFRCHIVN